MKALALALLTTTTGCFASWSLTKAAGGESMLDERVRKERMPMPDTREHLRVTMPLAPQFPPQIFTTPATTPATSTQATTPAVEPTALPFAFECTSTQTASDRVYRSGFRYGSKWKTATAIMFAVEASVAAAIYFSDRDKPANMLGGAVLGLDAVGTAALFFVPRKDILRENVEGVVSTIRTDCPGGLALHIGSETFAVDAAGRVGELGEAALDAWMLAPTQATPHLTYRERTIELRIGEAEICTWKRTRHEDQSTCPAYWTAQPAIASTLEVPMGTLTQIE